MYLDQISNSIENMSQWKISFIFWWVNKVSFHHSTNQESVIEIRANKPSGPYPEACCYSPTGSPSVQTWLADSFCWYDRNSRGTYSTSQPFQSCPSHSSYKAHVHVNKTILFFVQSLQSLAGITIMVGAIALRYLDTVKYVESIVCTQLKHLTSY